MTSLTKGNEKIKTALSLGQRARNAVNSVDMHSSDVALLLNLELVEIRERLYYETFTQTQVEKLEAAARKLLKRGLELLDNTED